jgi:CRP-like cAMP-binding protein
VATIGSDGYIGLSSHVGDLVSPSRFVVQVPGDAWRIPCARLRNWMSELPRLQALLVRYNDFTLAVAAQASACNRLHRVEQRCARWLLRVRDLTKNEDVPITQDFLAQMLGVRRASVSIAASLLQDAGLIRYSYGRITIVDHPGLERVACECAATLRRRHEASFAPLMG